MSVKKKALDHLPVREGKVITCHLRRPRRLVCLWFSLGAPACRLKRRPTVAGQRRSLTELSLDIENL